MVCGRWSSVIILSFLFDSEWLLLCVKAFKCKLRNIKKIQTLKLAYPELLECPHCVLNQIMSCAFTWKRE